MKAKDYRLKILVVRELLRDAKIIQAYDKLGEILEEMEKDSHA